MERPNKTWRSVFSAHSLAVGAFAVIFAFVFIAASFVVANGQTMGPTDTRVVSLYLDGQETVVPTRAATVKEFLEKTNIKLFEADLVEPGLDTQITGDNFNIQVYRARPITIIDGLKIERLLSPHRSAQLIVQKAGFSVYPEDVLTITTATDFVQDLIFGEKLIIKRATPVNLSLYGAPMAVYRTQATTVGEFLKERAIIIETGATLTPSEDTAISSNLSVVVSKFGKQVLSVEEEVKFEIESTQDPTKYINEITVIQPGVKGTKQVIYEIELKDSQEIARRVLQEVITTLPQKQIQTVGTKTPDYTGDKIAWMQAAGIAETDFYFVDFIMTHETHWRVDAINSSGCIGIGQNCPNRDGYYWLKEACPEWQNDPVCQLKRFSIYAGRYGGWQGAYNFWQQNRWW